MNNNMSLWKKFIRWITRNNNKKNEIDDSLAYYKSGKKVLLSDNVHSNTPEFQISIQKAKEIRHSICDIPCEEINIDNKAGNKISNECLKNNNAASIEHGISDHEFNGPWLNGVPTSAGVYVFILNEEILYAGQTNNFRRRLSEHTHNPKNKEWGETVNSVDINNFLAGDNYKTLSEEHWKNKGWIIFPLSKDDWNIAEQYLITKYQPKFNDSNSGLVIRNNKYTKINFLEYDGRGISKTPKTIEELLLLTKQDDGKIGFAGISGYTNNVPYKERRTEFNKFCRTLGLRPSTTRKAEFKVWIIGDIKTAKSAIHAIDDDDFVVKTDVVLKIIKDHGYEEWKNK